MTKIACKLVLNAGTIRLVWRSIKSLKNIHGDGSTVTERTIARDGSKNIPALRNGWQRQSSDGAMDEEILQLWSLLACHQALCVYLPFEAIMSTFIPFYFHIKFLVLLITFIPGTKFPNFWFYTVLVPGMDYVHDLLDVDYRYVIQSMVDEIHALPLQLIDLLFLPGQLWDFGEPRCYGAYVSEKKQQSEQSGMTFGNVQPPEILSNKCDDLHVATNIGRNLEKTTAKSAIEGEDNLSATSVEEILIDLDLSAEEESQMSERENEGTVNSGVVKRRSSKDLGVNISTSVDGSRRRSVSLVGKPTISRTMWRPRQSLDESTLGSRRNLHQFGRQPLFSFAKSSGITSPVAQSRLHASSLHLRKFSKDHENANVKKSPTKVDMNTTQRKPLREFVSEVVDPFNNAVAWDTVSGKENGSEASISTTSSPARSLRSIVQEMQSTPPAGARRSSRPSLGDNLRTMLTGDYHIRIRDYLLIWIYLMPQLQSVVLIQATISKTFIRRRSLPKHPNGCHVRQIRVVLHLALLVISTKGVAVPNTKYEKISKVIRMMTSLDQTTVVRCHERGALIGTAVPAMQHLVPLLMFLYDEVPD